MTDPVTDWRGTPITPGALVVYGTPTGRSPHVGVTVTEAVIADPMHADHGSIWVDVIRHSREWTGATRVKVHPRKVTVVAGLPPSALPTVAVTP